MSSVHLHLPHSRTSFQPNTSEKTPQMLTTTVIEKIRSIICSYIWQQNYSLEMFLPELELDIWPTDRLACALHISCSLVWTAEVHTNVCP